MLHMFQTVFPSIIRSTKLHIQHQAFVRLLWLPAARLYVRFCAPHDGRKNCLKRVQRLTELNKLEKCCILLAVL